MGVSSSAAPSPRPRRTGACPTEPNGIRPKVLIIGPVPPPAFGVAKATKLMLESPTLREHLEIVHLDTSDTLGFTGIGRLNCRNVRLGIQHAAQLANLLRKERPDVVLLTASQGLLGLIRDGLFVSLNRTFKVRTVTYLRGSGYAEMRQRQGWLAATLLRSILRHSSRVLVLCESLVEMASSACAGCQVAVVPNGSPPAVSADQVCIRDQGRPVVLYVGRLSREKGLEDALVAATTIAACVPAAQFVICGEWDSPEYERATKQLVDRLELADALSFTGPISEDQRARLLAQAWVLIVPSHSEGQPWVILEAMSAGLPVVATDTGAIADTVGNGLGGFVVPVGDSAALAERVSSLLLDDAQWNRMSQAAARSYRERFTVERSHALLADQLLQTAEQVDATTAWFSDNATRFDLQYGGASRFADRYDLWRQIIEASCGPESRVLDAGCGSGVFTAVAAQRGAQVVAVDPSQKMLDLCMSRCASLGLTSCTYRLGPIEELDSAGLSTFDLVLASSVLEYVGDLPRCLDVLGGLSRTGATMVSSLPNSRAPRRLIERVSFRLFGHPKYFKFVKNSPTLHEFLTLLSAAGFAVREVHYYGLARWLRPWSSRAGIRARFGTMLAVVATKL